MCSSGGKLSAEVIVKVQEDNELMVAGAANDELKTPKYPSDQIENPVVIKVRAEEILILVFVFILWISAIILFFNRWGKIRMLEPYQPIFMDTSQRASCHIPSVDNLIVARPRMSLSKYNVSCDIPSFSTIVNNRSTASNNGSAGCGFGNGYPYQSRARLNSVFVVNSSSSHSFGNYRPRRTKSAIDIHSIKLNEMHTLAKTKSTPIRSFNSELPSLTATAAAAAATTTATVTQRRRHSMLGDQRFSYCTSSGCIVSGGGGPKSKLAKSFIADSPQKLSNLRSYRRPSSSLLMLSPSPSPLATKRYPFRSFDQPSGHFYDYRRSSLLATTNCSASSSSLLRSTYPTKKILDRIKTLKSFDQPSFIIESPCETEPVDSVIIEVHDEHVSSPTPPSLTPPAKTDTVIVLANEPNFRHHHHHHHQHGVQVKKLNRSSSCTEHLNSANSFYRKNRYSADDISQM